MSQAGNAFRAQEWANGSKAANLRLMRISASSLTTGSFFMIRGMCIATWHNALAMPVLGLVMLCST